MNPQWHDEFVALCALFPSGELSDEEWALLQIHLAYCDSCLMVFRQYERLADKVMPVVPAIAYSDAEFEPETSSFSLDEAAQSLISQLNSRPTDHESHHRRKIRWQIPMGMLAACALGVAVFICLHFVRSRQFSTDFWHWDWPILPGICVSLLGAEALGITLIPVKALEERKWIKRTAIAVCFILVFGEIWMVKLDRKGTDEQQGGEELSQSQRAAILELNAKKVSKHEIARVLKVSRLTVREVLQSGSSEVPSLRREEKYEPYRQQILELHVSSKGNQVRVWEELQASGATLSYQALTSFCRRRGIGQVPKVAAGRYCFGPGE